MNVDLRGRKRGASGPRVIHIVAISELFGPPRFEGEDKQGIRILRFGSDEFSPLIDRAFDPLSSAFPSNILEVIAGFLLRDFFERLEFSVRAPPVRDRRAIHSRGGCGARYVAANRERLEVGPLFRVLNSGETIHPPEFTPRKGRMSRGEEAGKIARVFHWAPAFGLAAQAGTRLRFSRGTILARSYPRLFLWICRCGLLLLSEGKASGSTSVQVIAASRIPGHRICDTARRGARDPHGGSRRTRAAQVISISGRERFRAFFFA